jgi:glycosyltransferase involved in cell wall biosynthesis
MPDISIIIISHNKPQSIKTAVQGVLDQTHQNWEGVLVDSGILLNQGFFSYLKDPRLKVIPTGETPDMAKTTNMGAWCCNYALNSNLISGELVMYLCDDDLLYPEAFQVFWDFYRQHDRAPQAMYASQDIGLVQPDGKTQIIGRRVADRPAGRFCRGRKLDCRVDYLQFCHTARILDKFREVYKTTRYHSEDKRDAHHADGIFMEQIGALTKVYNIDKVLSMNRRTTESANLEYAASPLGRILVTLRAKAKGARERLFSKRRF